MKELSIEEKVRRYDEAIKYAYYLINERCKKGTDGSFHRADLQKMFPELAKSEDEKIRKEIIATIHLYYGEPLENEAKEMIAWLEKQGGHAKFCDSIQVGDKVTRNQDGVLVNLSQLKRVAKKDDKQGEQKSAWTEEDETMLERVIKFIPQCMTAHGYNEYINWFESIKDRIQPQNRWKPSDEQMEAVKDAIDFLGCTKKVREDLKSLYEQLKKLRED